MLYTLISIIHITIAKKLGIYDKPNSRSSHNFQTLNGGGIIFPISFLIPIIFILNIHEYVNLIIGTSLITLISLKDDLKPIKNSIRILIHLISVLFLLNHFNLSEISIFTLLISFILITGILNSYNFMDGINGLNGSYSLISLLSLLTIIYIFISLKIY